ncbi:cysteine proteinase [Xylariaceae sp. FL0255]|nr:cysteine proteinase [Xylariaceae sp. FL0255]
MSTKIFVRSTSNATGSERPPEGSPVLALKEDALEYFSKLPNGHVYMSPILLRRLLSCQIGDFPDNTGCQYHEFYEISAQSFKIDTTTISSILCKNCKYHYHVTLDGKYAHKSGNNHPRHLYIPCRPDSQPNTEAHGVERSKHTRFICAAESCYQNLEICRQPPRFSVAELSALRDNRRVFANLQTARAEDPQRYTNTPNNYGEDAIRTLIQYLSDALAPRSPESSPLRIKKRNKRFKVSFGTDLDEPLKRLGFEERTDDDGEECWYIPTPEPAVGATLRNTLRASMEDALAELQMSADLILPNAWKSLVEIFNGSFPEASSVLSAKDADASILGCLTSFPPTWIAWAAIRLATICPNRRDRFLDAGLSCVSGRSEEAEADIVMYKSTFDTAPSSQSNDPQLEAALSFFGVSFGEENYTDWPDKYRSTIEASQDEDKKQQAYQHLEIISRHMGTDLLEVVARDVSLPAANSLGRPTTVQSAYKVLGVDSNFSSELIVDFSSHAKDRIQAAQALEVLSESKRAQGLSKEAEYLQNAANFMKVTISEPNRGAVDDSRVGQDISQGPQSIDVLQTPLGLRNIGNTCYLNSLLQYFFNVKPIREMVLHYEDCRLQLDDAVLSQRRTGGNGTPVNLEEAIVAQQFMSELRTLFQSLESASESPACPSQKLANTALSSAKDILTAKPQTKPPPLPARPSPLPPTSTQEDVEMVNVTVERIDDQLDTASNQSSATLVSDNCDTVTETIVEERPKDEQEITVSMAPEPDKHDGLEKVEHVEHVEDVEMSAPTDPPTLEEKITQISQRLEQSDRSGTSQQDVEEIIGNILEHFMRAICPVGSMEGLPNLQADNITQTFFTTIVNSTIKTSSGDETNMSDSRTEESLLNEEVVPERWITAFPHPDKEKRVRNTLYEALDRYFSYELLADGNLARYTTIRALPPIVHICIQRTDATGVKNKNPVIIPEDLYLDRYMETETGSTLWKIRRRVWAVKERIKDLQQRAAFSVKDVFKPEEMHRWLDEDFEPGQVAQTDTEDSYIDWNDELWADVGGAERAKNRFDKRNRSPAVVPVEGQPPVKRPGPSEGKGRREGTDLHTRKVCANALFVIGKRRDKMDRQQQLQLSDEEKDAFSSMKQHKYCLHALICHGGGMNAGHYWVWIRDFEKQVWWKYNDSTVTKDSRDSMQVIEELNNSGDPYYVAYIRDDLKEDIVEVPKRTAEQEDWSNAINMDVDAQVIEGVEVIEGQEPPRQPANSPMASATPDTSSLKDTAMELNDN